uniref:Uncharacterized protein n=1 Tax=uncultured prokaryote TaxID=198431 RepID=A0A0H5Q8Q9_9ZZZZ|nr:hypothetical protein [uncultured prokaryote]
MPEHTTANTPKYVTEMIHYQCGVCSMTATVVNTPTSTLAWHDHMMQHARMLNFRSWTWAIEQMDLGPAD